MKCPKCGYVSFSGPPQCRKCGYSWVDRPPKPDSTSAPTPAFDAAPGNSPPAAEAARVQKPPAARSPFWREELSGRVQKFRRRRAGLRGGRDPGTSLDLAFDEPLEMEANPALGALAIESPELTANFDVALGAAESKQRYSGAMALEKGGEGMRILSAAAVEAGELPLLGPEQRERPVEIVLESPGHGARAGAFEEEYLIPDVAPLGRRFVAGLADALLLLAGAGLFALVFSYTGGHVALQPASLAVFAGLAALGLMAYFGIFTALAGGTPGLLWTGLEVVNLDGYFPTAAESFWRAFGYLVSFSSLMLGFVWALFDTDRLTWHDRVSGTYITSRD